jgi:hypothetical protein
MDAARQVLQVAPWVRNAEVGGSNPLASTGQVRGQAQGELPDGFLELLDKHEPANEALLSA